MFSICRQQVVSTLIRCTGRNFCVYKFTPRINVSVAPRISIRQCLGIHNVHNLNRPYIRYYSQKDDDDEDCGEKKKKVCKPKPIKECQPQDDCNKKQLPFLQECARPNLMTDCPKPDCPIEPPRGDGPNRNIILGLLALLGALAGIWYMLTHNKREVCTPPGKMMLKDKKKESGCFGRKPPVKDPKCSDDIPKETQYLLIGGGTAAFAAFRAIKSSDPRAQVLVVTDEEHFPYMRPPLSKELWYAEDGVATSNLEFKQWNGAVRSLFYEPNEFYLKAKDLAVSGNGGVAVAKGWTVSHLDVTNKKAYLEDGYEISYDKVLIATGSKPKNLDVIAKADECVKMRSTTYRTVADYQYLSKLMEKASSIAIIGGGFLGSELACALGRKRKFKVYQVFKERGHMGSVLPEYLSLWTTEKVKLEGVEVFPSTEVIGAAGSDKNVTLKLSSGKSITADLVIVAVGAVPETSMADKSCLEIDNDLGGYLVNTELQARSNVYVAGDSACFYDPALGRRRIEHHDNAVISGRLAGENMTGASKPYCHQSMFWSDLGPDIGYEAIGLVHSSLPTVGVFAKMSPMKEEIPEVDELQQIPDTCLAYLPPEEEEKQRRLKEEYEEKLRQVEEAKQRAKEDQKKAEEEAKSVPSPEYNKGVIFYLRDDIIVGIVLWNVFNRMAIARQVLKDQCKYEDLNEVAKLFNIHEEE